MSDLYGFKMSFFENGDPEELSFFVRNFNITLATSGTLETGAKIQYLRNIVRRESLHEFNSFYSYVEITQTLNIDDIIKGLAQYSYPINYI